MNALKLFDPSLTLEWPKVDHRKKWPPIFLWVIRLTLATVFIWAGITKLLSPAAFASSIATFQILPESAVNIVALGLPPFEILAGVLILIQRGKALGSLAIAGMSFVFLIALLVALIRDLPVDCGCFGSGGPSSNEKIWTAIGRDIALIAAATWVYSSTLVAKPLGEGQSTLNAEPSPQS